MERPDVSATLDLCKNCGLEFDLRSAAYGRALN